METISSATSSRPKILTVDGDPDIGMALTDLLEWEGYHVEVVQTGTEAISRVNQQAYCAVLLEIALPDGDGVSVFEALVALNPKVPIILLTAYTPLERVFGEEMASAYAYLTKPYDRQELKATLRQALEDQTLVVREDPCYVP